jgi:hypothetical protein
MKLRKLIASCLALFAFLFVIGAIHGCGTSLSDADKAHVAGDGVQISMCAAEAHLCKKFEQTGSPDAGLSKCWDDYDACLSAHGFRDGGAK